jgi:plastocyanin
VTRHLRTLPVLLPLLALLAACGSGSSGSAAGGTSVAAQGSGDAQTVTVKGNQKLQFEPQTVTAKVGTLRLTFGLDGSTPHDLEFKDAGVGPAIPTVTGAPVTGTFTFTKPGTYTFVCTIHPGMDGKVVVS